MSMGRDYVSELRPSTGLLFIRLVIQDYYGEARWPTTIPTLPNLGLRGERPATDRLSHDTTAPFGGQSVVHTSRRPNECVTGRSLGFSKQTNSDSNYTLTRSLHAYGYALSKVRRCLRHNLCSQPYGSKCLVRSTGSAV
jgi:hypothetical protein